MKNKNQCYVEELAKGNSKKHKPNKSKSNVDDFYLGCELVVDRNNKPINVGDYVQINSKNSNALLECEVIEIGAKDIITVLYDDYSNVTPIEALRVHSNEVVVI